jgi:hypothetical protein
VPFADAFCWDRLLAEHSFPQTVSVAPSDWLIAIAGSFAPLLLGPATWDVFPAASSIIALGTLLQIISLLSLNRSFALVAAKREIKTAWMYSRAPSALCLLFPHVWRLRAGASEGEISVVPLTLDSRQHGVCTACSPACSPVRRCTV